MKNRFLQVLFILLSGLSWTGCSDSDNNVGLANVRSAVAASPERLTFKINDKEAATLDLSVAFSAPIAEDVNFEVQVADDSEVAANKVAFSREHFSIAKGKRSFELTCMVEADAVAEGIKNLKIEFLPQHSDVDRMTLKIPIEKKLNTIVHVKNLNLVVDFADRNWASVDLPDGGGAVGGLFQTSVAIGSAPAVKRIHFDNYGQKVVGKTAGDLILITPLEEGTLLGSSTTWTLNPDYSDNNWMYMPVLYAEDYAEWLGKTAYVGMHIQGFNFWFKITATEDAVFTMTEYAYDSEGEDIKAGQTISE